MHALRTLMFATAACAACAAVAAEPPGLTCLPRRGLIAYWPADGDANDAIAGHNGKLMGGVTFVPGVSGRAFRFDGNSAHVSVDGAGIFGGRKTFTVSCWVFSEGGGHMVLTQSSSCPGESAAYRGRAVELAFNSEGVFGITAYGGAQGQPHHHNKLRSTGTAAMRQWHHVAYVFDHGEPAIYVNGRKRCGKPVYLDYSVSPERPVERSLIQRTGPTTEPVRIGAAVIYQAGAPVLCSLFRGRVDELAVWDRVLSAEEIASIAAAAEAEGDDRLREGLVAYWPADGDANDAAGKHHGAVGRGVTCTKDRHGRQNGAFAFAGNGALVTVPDHEDLDTDDSFTLTFWLRPESYVFGEFNAGQIVTKWLYSHQSNGDYIVELIPSGHVRFWVAQREREHVQDTLDSNTVVPKGKWTQVTAAFDRGAMRIYLNGKLDVSKVSQTVKHTSRREYSHDDIHIGGKWDGKYPFHGAVDDVAIWKRALTAGEVRELFEAVSLGELLRSGGGLAPPHVERQADADRVALADGQVLTGTLESEAVSLKSAFGQVTVAARDLAGLARAKDANDLWLLTGDGQAIRGTSADRVLRLRLSTGSVLSVPLASVKEFARRMAADSNAPAPGARRLVLRDGQRLNWCHLPQELTLRTAYGAVELPEGEVVRVSSGRGGHRAQFANGTILHGTLAPEKFEICTPNPPMTLTLRPQDVRSLTMGGTAEDAGAQATLTTRGGDVLIGEVAGEKLTVRTAYGEAALPATSLSAVTFDPNGPGKVAATQWDGVVLAGTLAAKEVAFRIGVDGPRLNVPVAQIVSITRTVVLPPPEIANRVEKLIARLGAESYRDREAAQKELEGMGKGIVPLLKPHANHGDPEVRQRVQQILEKFGAAGP